MSENKDGGVEHLLESVPLTIEAALDFAISEGRMTIGQAEECAEAYRRTFHGADDMLAGELKPVIDFPQ